jgi:hypothetical protein
VIYFIIDEYGEKVIRTNTRYEANNSKINFPVFGEISPNRRIHDIISHENLTDNNKFKEIFKETVKRNQIK